MTPARAEIEHTPPSLSITDILPKGLPPFGDWPGPSQIEDDGYNVHFDALNFPYGKNSFIFYNRNSDGQGTVIAINEGTQVIRMDWDKRYPIAHAPSSIRKQLSHSIGSANVWFQRGRSASFDTQENFPLRSHVANHTLVYIEGRKPVVLVEQTILKVLDQGNRAPRLIIASIPSDHQLTQAGHLQKRENIFLLPSFSVAMHMQGNGQIIEQLTLPQILAITAGNLRQTHHMGDACRNAPGISSRVIWSMQEDFGIRMQNNSEWVSRIEGDLARKACDRLRSSIR